MFYAFEEHPEKEIMTVTKKWYASKTLWFNLLALVVAIAAAFGYTGELPVSWGVFVPGIVAVINILLRLVTNKTLEF